MKVFGEDLDVLKEKGDEIVKVLSSIQGARDVKAEQVAGLPMLQVEVDRQKIARYGINVSDVLDLLEIAVAGKAAGEVFEGVKRFDLNLRFPEKYRNNPEAIGNLLVTAPTGQKIPLAQLVKKLAIEEGPAQISHEQARRRIVVEANVRGRDIGGFVEEAQKKT
jgi:cobalt-zinc-cadmium resistance protein CzcA